MTALGAALLLVGAAQATQPASSHHVFPSGGASFAGTPKTICVIKGQWADGNDFRYETWDSCSNMQIVRGTQANYADAISLGDDERFTGADIPTGSEVIEISNDFSSVIVFRDNAGRTREILIHD